METVLTIATLLGITYVYIRLVAYDRAHSEKPVPWAAWLVALAFLPILFLPIIVVRHVTFRGRDNQAKMAAPFDRVGRVA